MIPLILSTEIWIFIFSIPHCLYMFKLQGYFHFLITIFLKQLIVIILNVYY